MTATSSGSRRRQKGSVKPPAGALAARERVERVRRPLERADVGHGRARAFEIDGARPLARADEPVAAHERDLERGQGEADVDRGALRHVAEARTLLGKHDRSADARQEAEQGAHQRGLAAAVGSDDADGVAGVDAQRQRRQHRGAVIADLQGPQLDEAHARFASTNALKRSIEWWTSPSSLAKTGPAI